MSAIVTECPQPLGMRAAALLYAASAARTAARELKKPQPATRLRQQSGVGLKLERGESGELVSSVEPEGRVLRRRRICAAESPNARRGLRLEHLLPFREFVWHTSARLSVRKGERLLQL
jgi:hypothetical protein